MRSALATRVDRIASRIAKATTDFPAIICKLYDGDDADIVGLRMGAHRIVRQPKETIEHLLERGRGETGCPMWAADYRVIDRWKGKSRPQDAEKRNADGLF